MIKFLKWLVFGILILICLIFTIYFLGPKTPAPKFNTQLNIPEVELTNLDNFIRKKEENSGEIKADNEARIIWQDSIPKKTPFSIVYLHGFGASQGEGEPVHTNLADSLHANLYLARLAGHGLVKKEAFIGLTAEEYMQSAIDALAIGKLIGDQVIIVATSTGGSQALYLAATFPESISALVLYSPFIEMADPTLQKLSVGPWHEQISKAMLGDEISYTERADTVSPYWSSYYHLDAYNSLFSMVYYSTEPEILKQVKAPVFLAYYFKDEENQDDVVSVDAMLEMFDLLASEKKKAIAFPKTGNHVIASKWRSNDWKSVQDSSLQFLQNILTIKNQ